MWLFLLLHNATILTTTADADAADAADTDAADATTAFADATTATDLTDDAAVRLQ